MFTIYRYSIPIKDNFEIELPEGAAPLAFQVREGTDHGLNLWAMVDPDRPRVSVKFRIVGTGQPLTDTFEWKYLGTAQSGGGRFVWHLFVETGHAYITEGGE
jgi:hypothetical protein